MLPTLQGGDRLLVFRWPRIRIGHLVVVPDPRQPDRLLVKRVSQLARDSVSLAGDNPEGSTDSRHFGAVARTEVIGVAVYRYAPAGRTGRVH